MPHGGAFGDLLHKRSVLAREVGVWDGSVRYVERVLVIHFVISKGEPIWARSTLFQTAYVLGFKLYLKL